MRQRNNETEAQVFFDQWAVRDDTMEEVGRCDTRRSRMVRFSLHATKRAAQRNLVPDAVEYVLTHGRVLHRTGIAFYFLAARDVPAEDRHFGWAARLVGTVVLVGLDGEVITVYRNRRALVAIRRKLKYRIDMSAARTLDEREHPPTRLTA